MGLFLEPFTIGFLGVASILDPIVPFQREGYV